MNVKSGKKAERSKATRAALLESARKLFAQRGYAHVATEEIVRRAGVTRGALYHHFGSKRDLFRAVFEQLEQESAERIAAVALTESDPWMMQQVAWETFLDICREPDMQRIAVIDASSVLGWSEWHEIVDRYALGLIRGGLQMIIDAGLVERQPVEPLARMFLAMFQEAGMMIAEAEDVDAARAEVGRAIERMLDGLRVKDASG